MVTIDEAAKLLDVSVATIRNWVKMGYLLRDDKKRIYRSSLESFKAQKIGREKLTTRANKLYKQDGTHSELGISYDESLPESHRNREGIYYTPDNIVCDMLSKIDKSCIENKIFLDPCCGDGNFLVKALEMGIQPQNLYGYDIDPNAVKIARRRVEAASGVKARNIKCNDFLAIAGSVNLKVDYIFTNPPWGKKLDKKTRENLVTKYGAGKSYDTSSLFLFASIPLLKDGGQLGFLLQEALFNVATYSDIRRRLLTLNIEWLIDYDRAFKSLLTKAQAVIATKQEIVGKSPIKCQIAETIHHRSQQSLFNNPLHIFNLSASPAESQVIEQIFSKKHTTLHTAAKWGLGIVTGDNARFCSEIQKPGFKAIYRGSEITADGFKAPARYIDGNLALYQQAAPREMYEAPCKIVYKFICSRLCFVCDTEQRLLLNSANFFILDNEFPIPAEELVKLLNSDFMNWMFRTLFSTRKVLRSNIEIMPLFLDLLTDSRFDEDEYLKRLNIERCEGGSYRVKGGQ